MANLPIRKTARGIVFDPSGRVLLLRVSGGLTDIAVQDSADGFWITPGGRIEGHEDARAAIKRELTEETGIDAKIGRELFMGVHQLIWGGVNTILFERYFEVHTLEVNAHFDGMESDERTVTRGWRWWTVEELVQTRAVIFPRQLGPFLVRLRNHEYPDLPIELDIA